MQEATSDLDKSNKDDTASAKLGKLTALYAAASTVGKKKHGTKGAKRGPLDLSDSNWLVAPVDAFPTYFSVNSSCLDGLNVVKHFENYILSRGVPGNAYAKKEEPTVIIGLA